VKQIAELNSLKINSMKHILTFITFIFSYCGFSQQTYVPDDAFELYIETYISGASNGVNNDNYVNTIGIQNATLLGIQPALVPSGIINDYTGIEDFSSLHTMNIQNMNMTNVDLSALTIVSNGGVFDFQLTVQNCNILEKLILPHGGGLRLSVTECISLSNITYHSDNIIEMSNIISSCPSLTSFDISMVSFVELQAQIWLANNSSLECVNLKNGYCSNWSSVGITNNPLVTCVEVDNPSYCNTASGTIWNWEGPAINPNNIYSTNCACVASVGEAKVAEISLFPNPTTSKFVVEGIADMTGSNYYLLDQIGNMIQSGTIDAKKMEIDLSRFAEGVYWLKFENSLLPVQKIIKQ
jgi:hypothetical protein